MVKRLASVLGLAGFLLWSTAFSAVQAVEMTSSNPGFGVVKIEISPELSINIFNDRVSEYTPSLQKRRVVAYALARVSPSGTQYSNYTRGWASNVTVSLDKKYIYFVVNNEFSAIDTAPRNVITNSSITLKENNGMLVAYEVESGEVFEVDVKKPVSDNVFTFDGSKAIRLGYSAEKSQFELILTEVPSGIERKYSLDMSVKFADTLVVSQNDSKVTVRIFSDVKQGQLGYTSHCSNLGCAYGGHHFRVYGQIGDGIKSIIEVPFEDFK
ncbi:MAG: hypothetical protein NTV34_09105 [Proteobacteria bacterium]|nr:hypothetical protein [Pseudomonadota bacterium]